MGKLILEEGKEKRIYIEIDMNNEFHPTLIDICKMQLNKINGQREFIGRFNFDRKFLPKFLIELLKLYEE